MCSATDSSRDSGRTTGRCGLCKHSCRAPVQPGGADDAAALADACAEHAALSRDQPGAWMRSRPRMLGRQQPHKCAPAAVQGTQGPVQLLVGAHATGSAVRGCSCDWCELASARAVESMGLLPPAPPVPYTPVDTTATSAPTRTQTQMTAGKVLSCTAPGVHESYRISAAALWMGWLALAALLAAASLFWACSAGPRAVRQLAEALRQPAVCHMSRPWTCEKLCCRASQRHLASCYEWSAAHLLHL